MTSEPRPAGPLAWTTLATGPDAVTDSGPLATSESEFAPRRLVIRVVAAGLGVVVLVSLLGMVVVRRVAEQEAVNDAAVQTDLLARSVIMPALSDGLTADADARAAARGRLDAVVRGQALSSQFVRFKIWSPEGEVLYSDEARLIGSRFEIEPEELAVLADPATTAEVSDLSRPENRYERGQGPLLEVYRPVWTPGGTPLLFETYAPYSRVTQRTGDLHRALGGLMLSSLLLLLVLLAPVLWTLLDRIRASQERREQLLRHAVDASDDERRRIAADLHDGVVQELVAASLVIATTSAPSGTTAAGDAPSSGNDHLTAAAAAVRSAVSGLRTLLVDLYPPNLQSAGLAAALEDLAGQLRGRGMRVDVTLDPGAARRLDERAERLVYRIARETLRNAVKHAAATTLGVSLVEIPGRVRLDVTDNGSGFDPADLTVTRRPGHLGLQLLADLAAEHHALLALATAPGAGTRWRLEVAVAAEGEER